MMQRRASARRGFLVLEWVIGTAILGLLMLAVGRILADYRQATTINLTRQRLSQMAEARMEELRGGALPLENRTWITEDDVRIEIDVQAGEGTWAPLKLVTLSASTRVRGHRELRVQLKSYVAPRAAATEVKP